VSQPCCQKPVPQPGKLDPSLHEFWAENHWQLSALGFNVSAYERNRAFLNRNGKAFLDISFLTAADSDGDGRAVVAADFRHVGKMDLLVRQAGGGPLLLYENHFPQKHYLMVSLRGSASNRQGIGARLTAVVKGQQLVRELYPACSFRSQAPNQVHFGLADANTVDRLTIQWPSGKVQVLTSLKADRHLLIDESKDGPEAIRSVVPGAVGVTR
jgi:hypothetical protein